MTSTYHTLPSTTWVGENYYACGVLAFLVGVAYVPDIAQAAAAGRWLVLGAGIPLLLLRTEVHPRLPHWLGLGFLAYAGASWFWSTVFADWVNSAIQLGLIAGAFCLAAELRSLRGVWIGAGLALCINTVVALDQLYGYRLVPALIPPAGFFVNKNLLGEACAVVAVALAAERLWWLALPVAFGAGLSWSRGAWVAMGVCAVIWLWGKSKLGAVALATLATSSALAVFHHEWLYELGVRFEMWHDAWDGVWLWGHGLGQFYTSFQIYSARTYALGLNAWHLHNDALEIIFELGLGAIPLFALALLCLWRARLAERLALVALVVESSVGFPLFSPYTLFIGACAAGYAIGNGSRVRDAVDWGKLYTTPWFTRAWARANYVRHVEFGSALVSLGSRTPLCSSNSGDSDSAKNNSRAGDRHD